MLFSFPAQPFEQPNFGFYDPDMRFGKKFTPPDFQGKDFTPLISLNFNSFSVFGEIYTTGKKNYTAGGSDGSDKSHLCYDPLKRFEKLIYKGPR